MKCSRLCCRKMVSSTGIPCIVLIVGLLAAKLLYAQDAREKPILVLDPGGHSADIYGLAFTPDGKTLITSSSDGTVRFWDVATGAMIRVLRLPIYGRNTGKESLSPDGKLLAVSLRGPEGDHGIALIALPEGRILRYLKGHTDHIYWLAFSPDGTRLASASTDTTARLWNVASGECEHVLSEHRKTVAGVVFSPDGSQLVTSSSDGTARVWSVATGKCRMVLKDNEVQTYPLTAGVGWSPAGETIITSDQRNILCIWNADGTLRKRVPCARYAQSFRFVNGSKALFYAGSHGAFLLDLEREQNLAEFTILPENTSSSAALSPDEKIAASGGRTGEELYTWRITDGQPIHHLAGPGCSAWGVAWSPDGMSVAWGNAQRVARNRRGAALATPFLVTRSFCIADLDFGPAPDMTWRQCLAALGSLTIEVNFGNGQVSIKEGDEILCALKTSRPCASTFVAGDRIAVGGGREMQLRLYDARTGQILRQFQGHTGDIRSLAPSPDNRYLLSSASDQTLRIWSFDRSEPLLSLFFAGDQWIAWTPEGYYAASPGGERLMGWQVNNGLEQMGTFYPAAQFRKSLYRPDVIKLLLQAGSLEKALEMADRALGKASQRVEVGDVLPPRVHITSLRSSRLDSSGVTAEVSFLARSVGPSPITTVRLFVDGRPYPGSEFYKTYDPPRDGELRESWTFKLDPGPHTVAVQAESSVSRALSESVEVVFGRGMAREDTAGKEAAPQVQLPSLYVLAVGVSEYPGNLKLNYAAADAKALVDVYQEHAKPLYRRVEVKLIVDKEATRRNILQGLTWLRKQMTQNDVAVISFAGHGAKDHDGTFYLLPVDADQEDLLSTAIPGDQIKRTLAGIPGRFILLLDACHAGAVEGESRRAAVSLTDDLVRDLATDDYGVIVMCSAMGREFSLESPQIQHGYFTLALVEGLSGKADYNHDGVVQLNELDLYVTDRVKELSQGKQHPVTARPTSIRSFPLTRQ